MPGCALRVAVVDDNESVHPSICRILRSQADIEIVCEAADGDDAVSKIREHQPDIVLLDISMASMDGLEVARDYQDRIPLGSGSHRQPTRISRISMGRIRGGRQRIHNQKQRWQRPGPRAATDSRFTPLDVDGVLSSVGTGRPALTAAEGGPMDAENLPG